MYTAITVYQEEASELVDFRSEPCVMVPNAHYDIGVLSAYKCVWLCVCADAGGEDTESVSL